MKNIALIPARSGSKGFVDKNIAKLCGITLIELAVNVAKNSSKIDDVYISTDSHQYEQNAKDAGAKSLGLRPKQLAGDTVKTIDVVTHFIQQFPDEITNLILLQPTSPIRTPEQIDTMLDQLYKDNVDAVVSIEKINEPHPYKMKVVESGYISEFVTGSSSEVPRQLMPDVFKLTGSIYVNRIESLIRDKTFLPEKTTSYLMEKTINIDTEEDYILLLALHEKKKIDVYGI